LTQAITVATGATATVANAGSGTLTVAGTVTKTNSNVIFNAGGQSINVTGTIVSTGATMGSFNSDAYFTNGTTTLSSQNSYVGPTHIYGGGTVVNGINNALPISTIVELGSSDATSQESSGYTNTYELNGYSQSIAGLTSTQPSSGTDVNSVIGGNSGTTSHLTLTGTGTGSLGEGTFGTAGNAANNNLAVTFSASNAITLTGSNTYTGGTTITSGTLVVTNTRGSATGTGALTLQTPGLLTGTGTINSSNNTINGTITPGTGATDTTSVLTMTASGTTTFSGAHLSFNLATSGLPHVDGSYTGQSTSLALGATPTILLAGTSLTLNLVGSNIIPDVTQYTLITSTVTTGMQGAFADLVLGTGNVIENVTFNFTNAPTSGYYGRSYLELVNTGSGFNIDVEVIPEPGTWALMLGGLALLVLFQRVRRSREP
jgi:autotransporter-associated beta strand protein